MRRTGLTHTNTHISLTPHYFRCFALQTERKTPQRMFVSVFVLRMRKQQTREREKGQRERFNLNYPYEQRHLTSGYE